MNVFIIILLLFHPSSFGALIKQGIYNIITLDNLYLNYNKKITISNCYYKSYSQSLFKIYKEFNNQYYSIELVKKKRKLGYSNKNLIIILCREKYSNIEWKFIKIENNNYIIKNKQKCYFKIKNFKITCEKIPFEQATRFKLIKIYEEAKVSQIDNEIIEKEPIDVVIKYIDMRDPNLKRNEIHQIQKDYDNEELRYSIRSILENIPWVNKIFIFMPNIKVRYFKEYNFIKKKIIYIKDHDILGHESSNTNAFLFNLWKLKEFGLSDNFIYMDDDYFIGQKLKKTDFFYVNKDKVVPAIVSSSFLRIDKNIIEKNYNLFKKKAYMSKEEQSSDIFNYSLYSTYFFISILFHKDIIIIPKFNHNAIPLNVIEVQEIYEIVKRSRYKKTTLDSLYRHIESVNLQAFYLSYFFIKHKKKINSIRGTYIDVKNIIFDIEPKVPLFCINTGSGNYSYLNFYKAQKFMNYLFPNPTPYEFINNSLINKKIFKHMEKEEKLNKINAKVNKKVNILYSELLLFSILIILLFIKFLLKEIQIRNFIFH